MKHLKFLAALCCMLAVFTACEKNEPSDNTNGNGINTDQNGGNSNTGSDNATGTANGHEWVDLGLPSGLKWATCNVGAITPKAYGNYYAWGETEPKTTYDWSPYKWCNGSESTLTKYCTSESSGKDGFTDGKTVLEPEDDAAAVNWGGAWRMPTDAEWKELIDNSIYTWTDDYNGTGVSGGIVTGLNGNSIFFPAAGCRYDDDLSNAGNGGLYWSSSLYADSPDRAWRVYFYSGRVYRYDDGGRYCGLSVRPVLGE